MSAGSSHAGRVAVVTGAAGGFGYAISCELARRGADIVAVDLRPADEVVAAVQETGQKAVAVQADVSDPDEVGAITPELLGFAAAGRSRTGAGAYDSRAPTRSTSSSSFSARCWSRALRVSSASRARTASRTAV